MEEGLVLVAMAALPLAKAVVVVTLADEQTKWWVVTAIEEMLSFLILSSS